MTSKKPEPPVPSVDADLHRAEAFLTYLHANPDIPIALDTETTGLSVKDGQDTAIGVSLAAERNGQVQGFYYPVGHRQGPNVSEAVFTKLAWVIEHRPVIIFQNAKFDLCSLETVGIEYAGDFYDTIVLAHLLDENTPVHKDLDSLSRHYLGVPGKVDDPYVDWEKKHGNQEITYDEIWDYAVQDAVTTYLLGKKLIHDIFQHKDLPAVWTAKMHTIQVLKTMEQRGVRIDVALAQEQAVAGRRRMAEIVDLLHLNPGSKKDQEALFIGTLGLPILKTSEKTGKPSFDKTVMEQYEEILAQRDDPTAALLLEYRGWQKAVSAAYEPYIKLTSPDGRLRCNYRLDRARTGRFSCEQPNLQQVPKSGDKPWNKHSKQCFIPAEGYVLINADYHQLELRLATVYADEPRLREAFNAGRDVFTEMAASLGFDRQTTKTFVYSTQYGAGEKRIMSAFGVSRDRARRMIQTYNERYPHFRSFNERVTQRAEEARKVRLWSGRYRHFLYASDSYKAMNSVIQGGAADLVERVMWQLYTELDDDERCRMLLQVHDSVVFEVREDLVDEYVPLIKECMEDVCGATGVDEFSSVIFAVEVEPDYGSKGWGKDASDQH